MLGFEEQDPGRYALEYAVCREMGWSWLELQETPADFVDEVLERARLREKWRKVREGLKSKE